MIDQPMTFISLSIATLTMPAAIGADERASAAPSTLLVGAGLLIAERRGARWRFTAESTTASAGQHEQNVLPWLADRLPQADTLIGWQIDHHLVPALISAAARAEPAVAHHLTQRLARALRGNVVDLSIGRSFAASGLAKEVDTAPSMEPAALRSAWRTARLDAVRADLKAEALGSWLLFLREAQRVGAGAEKATRDWMDRRQSIHPVADGN